MEEKSTGPELWKRKYGPISDWKPVEGPTDPTERARKLFSEAVEGIGKGKEALSKVLEPFTEEARTKIKEMVVVADEIASKSSVEARTFLANIMTAVAEKIRPK